MNINYAPLQQDPTPQQLTAFRGLSDRGVYYADVEPSHSYVFVLIISLIGGFVGGMAIGAIIWVLAEQLLLMWLTAVVVAAAIAWAVTIFYRRRETRALKYGCKLFSFLQANPQFVYRAASADESKGAIFLEMQPSGFVMELADGSFRIGNHQYQVVVEQGDSYKTVTYKWGYLAVKLNRMLPHMILDAKSNNLSVFQRMLHDKDAGLPANIDKNQILSLEGDFNNYFTLYAPNQYERDALYIFTPDLMSLLIDNAQAFDVEIIDDCLYFYVRDGIDMTDANLMSRLFSLVDVVGAKALHQTSGYADGAMGNRAVNTVAEQGRRLREPRWDIVTGGTFVVVAIIWLWTLLG